MPGDKGEGQGNKEEGLTKRHKEIFKSEEYVYIYIYICQNLSNCILQIYAVYYKSTVLSKYVKNVKHNIEGSF